MDSSNVMPSVGEYLSGWYLSDNLLKADLTSLSFAPLRSPKAPKESSLLFPTPSGLNLGAELFSLLDPGGGLLLSFLAGGGDGGGLFLLLLLLLGGDCGGGAWCWFGSGSSGAVGGGSLLGRGWGIGTPGCFSFSMCQFQVFSSCAM